MLIEHLATNYTKLSHYVAKEVEKLYGWRNLVSNVNSKIILHCLNTDALWDQLVNYTNNDKAKGFTIKAEIHCNDSKLIKPNINGTNENSYGGHGYKGNFIVESKILNLDEQLLETSLKIRHIVNEKVLPHIMKSEFGSSCGKVIDFTPYFLNESIKSISSLDINSQLRNKISDDYDCDSDAEDSQPIVKNDSIILCLVDEISKLNFNFEEELNINEIESEDIYHDIIYDRDVLNEVYDIFSLKETIFQKDSELKELKQRLDKLNQVESPVESEDEDEKTEDENNQHQSPIFNCDRGPLKFLMNLIDRTQNKLSSSKSEIRSLVGEMNGDDGSNFIARNHKTELYVALEMIVQNLIDFKEHSFPFLNPVQRKNAPDYHRVISNPMDLSTLSRRVKARKYQTQQDFEKDLFLIYSNCRKYNTAEGNEYIKHADAMEDHSKSLLKSIPEDFNKPFPIQNGRRASFTPINMNSKRSSSTLDAIGEIEERHANSLLDRSQKASTEYRAKESINLRNKINEVSNEITKLNEKLTSLKFKVGLDQDPRLKKWLSITRDARANNRLMGFALTEKKFDDCPMIIQGSSNNLLPEILYNDLERNTETDTSLTFSKAGFNHLPSNGVNGIRKLKAPSSSKVGEKIDVYKVYPELNMSATVPRISNLNDSSKLFDEDYIDQIERNQPNLAEYKEALIPDSHFSRVFMNSIAELKCTQEMNDKIGTAEEFLGDDLAGSHNAEALRSTIHYLSTESKPNVAPFLKLLSDKGKLLNSPIVDNNAANEMCIRSTSLLLQNAGFESCQDHSLKILAQIMGEYIEKLGKTMRIYMDLYGNEMTAEEMLLHTLYENKVSSIEDISDYLEMGLERQCEKFREAQQKLKDHFNTLISRPSGSGINEEGEFDFDKGLDTFMAGNFEDVTGDDFFGFKELGLDRELGLDTLSVPARLLLGHKRQTFAHIMNGMEDSIPPDYTPPPAYSPITQSTEVIGLLKEYFDQRLNDAPDGVIEDDSFPPRKSIKPKVPPVGKQIIILRRKMVEHEAQVAAKREKKEKENEERNKRKKIREEELENKRRIRKAERLAKAQAKEEERAKRRTAKAAIAEARKAELEQKRINSRKTNANYTSPTPTTPQKEVDEDNDSLFGSSPRSKSTSPSPTPSPNYTSPAISSTSSDDDEKVGMSSRNKLMRKNSPGYNIGVNSKKVRFSHSNSQGQQPNGRSDSATISSTSEDSDSDLFNPNLKRSSNSRSRNFHNRERA